MLRTWLALILAPSTALGVQSIMYALVTPACASQTRLGLHVAAAVGLAVAVVLAVLAFGDWSLHQSEPGASVDRDHGDRRSARHFLAVVATGIAALSALLILVMWFNTWVLSPCHPYP